MHYGRSKNVKVVNIDGASVTTKVVLKQLRYMPITLRLKRLYLSEETTKQMRWHKEGKHDSEDPDTVSHPTNSEAWEALNRFDPEFARDHRSVRLDMSINSFQPHNNNSSSYSCWSVFVMPYNLPPNKCPLMEEMKELWQGVDAYDIHLKCRFNLRAAYL
jgi:hypothetical protein